MLSFYPAVTAPKSCNRTRGLFRPLGPCQLPRWRVNRFKVAICRKTSCRGWAGLPTWVAPEGTSDITPACAPNSRAPADTQMPSHACLATDLHEVLEHHRARDANLRHHHAASAQVAYLPRSDGLSNASLALSSSLSGFETWALV